MDVLDRLIEKLNILSKDFEFILNENKKLKKEIERLQIEKEKLERNSQDAILAIKNKLNQERKF